MKDFGPLCTNLCSTRQGSERIAAGRKCLFINKFGQRKNALAVLENGTLHASFEVWLPSARSAATPPNGQAMVATAPIWVTFGLLASCTALCQSPDLQTSANTLPSAPSVRNESAQTTARTQSLRDVFDATHLSVWERANVGSVSAGSAANLDLGHFDRPELNRNGAPDFLAKRIFASTLSQSNSNQTSESETLIRRAGYAAASVVMTVDDTGRRRLNTSYLLWVLTATAAHSAAANSAAAHNAYFPNWRRPLSSPAGDFGSTIGDDAGMNVFHEFKPGILQLVKSHEPKFVSAIGERIGK